MSMLLNEKPVAGIVYKATQSAADCHSGKVLRA